MLRSHTCGELRIEDINKTVTLSGWVQKIRDKGGLIWIDLRDRYGITQLLLEEGRSDSKVIEKARQLGREFVIQAKGMVIERASKNPKIPSGEIEIDLAGLEILNASKTPPFTIEDETDGGEELRMKYRYLDLRRNPLRDNLALRNRLSIETRKYLDSQSFFEIETPYLIKSTPEGARDFVVPSRMNEGQFYALPQSPQTFKQLLMVAGYDKYYQLVKCFRDEDLRADRQPEFTQIDCEMAFVEQDDVLNTFEGLVKYLFKEVKGVDIEKLPHMTYADAMKKYGSDKPDIRFGMEFVELNDVAKGKGFKVFDDAELVVGINAKGCAHYSRKQLEKLTEFVKKPQIGAKGLVYLSYGEGSLKSSAQKFFTYSEFEDWLRKFDAKPGDLMLVLSGETDKVRKQLCELRLHMSNRIFQKPEIVKVGKNRRIRLDSRLNICEDKLKGLLSNYPHETFLLVKVTEHENPKIISGKMHNILPIDIFNDALNTTANSTKRKRLNYFIYSSLSIEKLKTIRNSVDESFNPKHPNNYKPLWVVDFPLLEWDEDSARFHAMHHPFTSPKTEDIELLESNPGGVRANAYDLVINGVEIGGGSIRIHDRTLQKQMFTHLGFTEEEAQDQFGFLMNAFEYGAPPHGGIALGFDRLVALFAGQDSIRDFIAFPKNNSGRDVMIDSPSPVANEQLEELGLKVVK